MPRIILVDPGDTVFIPATVDDLDGIPISSVVWTLPSGLSNLEEDIDQSVNPPVIAVKVTGVQHGVDYMIEAAITLLNGETINRQYTARGFNA